MNDNRTVPNPALKKAPETQKAVPRPQGHYIPAPRTMKHQGLAPKTTKTKGKIPTWVFLLPVAFVAITMLCVGGAMLGVFLSYSNSILPRVQVGEIELGGLSQEEAAQELSQNWGNFSLS